MGRSSFLALVSNDFVDDELVRLRDEFRRSLKDLVAECLLLKQSDPDARFNVDAMIRRICDLHRVHIALGDLVELLHSRHR